jgi:hypothetical protein
MRWKEFVECVGEIQILKFTRTPAGENSVGDGGVDIKEVRLNFE